MFIFISVFIFSLPFGFSFGLFSKQPSELADAPTLCELLPCDLDPFVVKSFSFHFLSKNSCIRAGFE
jgi:hypothetical protein